MSELANHLWQSTVFAGLVALAALALRRNEAKTRYWLWFVASIKFLVPFPMLVSLGNRVDAPVLGPVVPALAVEQISTTFAPVAVSISAGHATTAWWPVAAVLIWFSGSALLLARWFQRWLTIRRALAGAPRSPVEAPIPVFSPRSDMEPGVFGIWRPVLLLPADIARRLSSEELESILTHELAHVRRRDNLTAAVHMLVESLFWFHPAVWFIGSKLVEERERACDEAVLEKGSERQVYAQSILNVCRHYVETPLPCTSGVTGADLRHRIEEIMTRRVASRLPWAGKLLLAGAGIGVAVAPLLIGFLRAQTLPPPPQYTYEVVSVRPSKPGELNSRIGPGPQGGMRTENTTTMQLLTFAYNCREYQLNGGPDWVNTARFDVRFTPDKPEIALGPGVQRAQAEAMFGRQRQRMQAILRDRFGLVLRAEVKELPVYALTIAKGGHKLKTAEAGKGPHLSTSDRQMTANAVYMNMVTPDLAGRLGRPVLNETGLDGPFDFRLEWTADSDETAQTAGTAGVSIFTALTEQLGLKLQSKKGPVPVFVIEKIEKPSEN